MRRTAGWVRQADAALQHTHARIAHGTGEPSAFPFLLEDADEGVGMFLFDGDSGISPRHLPATLGASR
jgi:hypothetical protein